MTAALEKAFAKASHLPKAMQEQLAEQLLEDIEGELKWDVTFEKSQDVLEQMAAKARLAKKKGNSARKGFDNL